MRQGFIDVLSFIFGWVDTYFMGIIFGVMFCLGLIVIVVGVIGIVYLGIGDLKSVLKKEKEDEK